MLIMKSVKKLFIFISALFIYPLLALPAFADTPATGVNPCDNASGTIASALCALGGNNVAKTLQGVVIFLVVLAVIVALIYLLYGGIRWILSKGEKTEVESARNHIMAAILGLVVVFVAIFIISVILAVFGIDIKNLKLPTIGSSS